MKIIKLVTWVIFVAGALCYIISFNNNIFGMKDLVILIPIVAAIMIFSIILTYQLFKTEIEGLAEYKVLSFISTSGLFLLCTMLVVGLYSGKLWWLVCALLSLLISAGIAVCSHLRKDSATSHHYQNQIAH